MERIPVIRMGAFLLVSVYEEIEDRQAINLETDLFEAIVKASARGVLIDISGLGVVDSFTGRMLANIAEGAKLLGAETVVVGMRPAVAMTIVELGLSLAGVHTALTVAHGMAKLSESGGADAH